eukprot:TRINITY_DN23072_c0_g2_i1.p1 TRINITY_DN23072_c0_g2~~TRINITY_DN23072_c0_g2_i1.p1  ORF type:complete len:846 (+),score=93.61 TRINITY_DN23072_c0_g2_i1:171-2708(+)
MWSRPQAAYVAAGAALPGACDARTTSTSPTAALTPLPRAPSTASNRAMTPSRPLKVADCTQSRLSSPMAPSRPLSRSWRSVRPGSGHGGTTNLAALFGDFSLPEVVRGADSDQVLELGEKVGASRLRYLREQLGLRDVQKSDNGEPTRYVLEARDRRDNEWAEDAGRKLAVRIMERHAQQAKKSGGGRKDIVESRMGRTLTRTRTGSSVTESSPINRKASKDANVASKSAACSGESPTNPHAALRSDGVHLAGAPAATAVTFGLLSGRTAGDGVATSDEGRTKSKTSVSASNPAEFEISHIRSQSGTHRRISKLDKIRKSKSRRADQRENSIVKCQSVKQPSTQIYSAFLRYATVDVYSVGNEAASESDMQQTPSNQQQSFQQDDESTREKLMIHGAPRLRAALLDIGLRPLEAFVRHDVSNLVMNALDGGERIDIDGFQQLVESVRECWQNAMRTELQVHFERIFEGGLLNMRELRVCMETRIGGTRVMTQDEWRRVCEIFSDHSTYMVGESSMTSRRRMSSRAPYLHFEHLFQVAQETVIASRRARDNEIAEEFNIPFRYVEENRGCLGIFLETFQQFDVESPSGIDVDQLICLFEAWGICIPCSRGDVECLVHFVKTKAVASMLDDDSDEDQPVPCMAEYVAAVSSSTDKQQSATRKRMTTVAVMKTPSATLEHDESFKEPDAMTTPCTCDFVDCLRVARALRRHNRNSMRGRLTQLVKRYVLGDLQPPSHDVHLPFSKLHKLLECFDFVPRTKQEQQELASRLNDVDEDGTNSITFGKFEVFLDCLRERAKRESLAAVMEEQQQTQLEGRMTALKQHFSALMPIGPQSAIRPSSRGSVPQS